MLLGVMLFWVGAVLVVNGIWLIGQARAAEPVTVAAGADAPALGGGEGAEPAPAAAKESPLLIQGREVAVINIFTGFVGVVVSVILLVQGSSSGDLASARGAAFILLFAFTYLWVAFNQFLDAGGRAFGWYCLFVAITAVPAGIHTLQNAGGNPAVIWLAIDWFLWAVLWGVFWALLALDRPVARLAGWLAIILGIVTCWVLGFVVLIGLLSF
jgi:putative amide transporter protein